MVLLDTSVWVEVFRKNQPLDLEKIIDFDRIVTCLPVIQEVLQGFRVERAFRHARQAMYALPRIESPLEQEVFDQAISIYRAARRRGLTIRSSVDCLIAACALRHDLCVLHRDRDYTAIAEVSELRVQRLP
ncbi:MAG: PIN domain-containing protein [Deltaproteobacteria bacterium]|nr:PIN domain-containing protein [Deltaproteobacteria bacterium]